MVHLEVVRGVVAVAQVARGAHQRTCPGTARWRQAAPCGPATRPPPACSGARRAGGSGEPSQPQNPRVWIAYTMVREPAGRAALRYRPAAGSAARSRARRTRQRRRRWRLIVPAARAWYAARSGSRNCCVGACAQPANSSRLGAAGSKRGPHTCARSRTPVRDARLGVREREGVRRRLSRTSQVSRVHPLVLDLGRVRDGDDVAVLDAAGGVPAAQRGVAAHHARRARGTSSNLRCTAVQETTERRPVTPPAGDARSRRAGARARGAAGEEHGLGVRGDARRRWGAEYGYGRLGALGGAERRARACLFVQTTQKARRFERWDNTRSS